jgi:hypothetical protein
MCAPWMAACTTADGKYTTRYAGNTMIMERRYTRLGEKLRSERKEDGFRGQEVKTVR